MKVHSKKREEILKVINNEEVPITAKDIFSKTKNINLATIYRALKYLTEKNLIKSFSFNCNKEGMNVYYHKKQIPNKHFFHCTSCHKFFPFENCKLKEEIEYFESKYNCEIGSYTLNFTGICGKCKLLV